jgi:hypothetical protein
MLRALSLVKHSDPGVFGTECVGSGSLAVVDVCQIAPAKVFA